MNNDKINFACPSCGKPLQASIRAIGKISICRACGHVGTVPSASNTQPPLQPPVRTAQTVTLPNSTTNIPLGSVRSGDTINFSFEVKGSSGRFQIFAMHRDRRKANILLQLGHKEFVELKNIIAKADETIHALVEAGTLQRPWNAD